MEEMVVDYDCQCSFFFFLLIFFGAGGVTRPNFIINNEPYLVNKNKWDNVNGTV